MATFSVWAPEAGRVEVVVEGGSAELSPAGSGWWSVELPQVGPGADYRFRLDGGEALPDPRSRWQPEGPHGPSRVWDPSAYAWGDAGWRGFHLPSAVLYELHVGTFTEDGTFDAATRRLDELVDLGVTAVEVMPINTFPGAWGWGYDGVDLFAPHPAYGGPEGFQRFVDACHRKGLGVVLDVVYNHLGPDGNYLGRFGPYFTDTYHTPWGEAVNLDGPGSDEVRAFFVHNALMWLRDYHVDGLRLDAVHAFFDRSAVHFLEELGEAVRRLSAHLGRPLHVIAESDLNDPRIVRPVQAGGFGLAAMWSDDFHHALHTVLTGERTGYYEDFGAVADLARALSRGFVYAGTHAPHRGRRHGRPTDGLSGAAFLGYLQNHDQVGNRARGDRFAHVAGEEAQKVGAALVLTAPFVPLIFQGEEWASASPFPYFTQHPDPELGEAVRQGRRREFAAFGWDPEEVADPQDPGTFRAARLDWEARGRPPHAGVLDWYRTLIALRKAEPQLTDGRLDEVEVHFDEAAKWLVMHRGPLAVAVTLGEAARDVPLPDGAWRVRAASRSDVALTRGVVHLPGLTAAVLDARARAAPAG